MAAEPQPHPVHVREIVDFDVLCAFIGDARHQVTIQGVPLVLYRVCVGVYAHRTTELILAPADIDCPRCTINISRDHFNGAIVLQGTVLEPELYAYLDDQELELAQLRDNKDLLRLILGKVTPEMAAALAEPPRT